MDLSSQLSSLQSTLGEALPNLQGALLTSLAAGSSVVVRGSFRRDLALVRLNERVESSMGNALVLEGGICAGKRGTGGV
jgi:hypothetical protein